MLSIGSFPIRPSIAYPSTSRPQFRLRVEDLRIFYDVAGSTVEVLAVVSKSQAGEWLAQFGEVEP